MYCRPSAFSSFKPDFFVRNNLEIHECRVLVSRWTEKKGWEKLATGIIEATFSIECSRTYLHFLEDIGRTKLFEVDLNDFNYKQSQPGSIELIHKNSSFDIALVFCKPATAQKYLSILLNFDRIKRQLDELTEYKKNGECLFKKLQNIISAFSMEHKDDFLGGLLWYCYNDHTVFSSELDAFTRKNFNEKETMEKLLGVIVTLYAFKCSNVFSCLLEDSFFELTQKIKNRFVFLATGSHAKDETILSDIKWINLMIENLEDRKLLLSFAKFVWIFKHVLEPYLDSKDLSAYCTFLKLFENSISLYLSSNAEVMSKILEKNDFLEKNASQFSVFVFGNQKSFHNGTSLFKKALKHLIQSICALEFYNCDGKLILKESSPDQRTVIMNQIEILSNLSHKHSEVFVETLLSFSESMKKLFCLMVSENSEIFSVQFLMESIFELPEFQVHHQSEKEISSSLQYLVETMKIRIDMNFVKLLISLLKFDFGKQIHNSFCSPSILRSLINFAEERSECTSTCVLIASLLNHYVSCFRFIPNPELLSELVFLLFRNCKGKEGMVWCQLGFLAKSVAQTSQGPNFLKEIRNKCSEVQIEAPKWLGLSHS